MLTMFQYLFQRSLSFQGKEKLANRRGFTALELLALTAIGATLTAVSFTSWNSGSDRLFVDNAASKLSATLQAGRFQAIRSNQTVAVYLADATTIVTELGGCNSGGDILNQFDLAESAEGLGINWNNTGGVVWQTNGLARSCSGGLANQTIELALNDNTEEITVNGAAGRVQKQ